MERKNCTLQEDAKVIIHAKDLPHHIWAETLNSSFHIFNASPMSFLILTSIIYLFTETLVMFFFVGTGVSIKEYMLEKKIHGDFHKRSINIKRRIYPPQLLNLFILILAFILFGAADTHQISPWLYRAVLLIGIVQYLDAKIIQNTCFRDNTKVILDMSGIKRA